jgi:hypothetical protein
MGGKDTFMEHGQEKKVESSLSISLYYDGDEQILVKTWTAQSPINSMESLYNRMFDNPDALLKQDKPIENLLWEFEQTPLSCDVNPEKDTVSEDETIQIHLSNFQGQSGPSKSFNRILVQADHGEILNGTPSSSLKDARVFKVGSGTVSVEYKSPSSCEHKKDFVHVYNSCDIAKQALVPLSETETRGEIAKQEIKISCGGEWTGTIHLEQVTSFVCSDKKPREFEGWDALENRTTQKLTADFDVRIQDIAVFDEGIDIKRGDEIETSGALSWSLEQYRKRSWAAYECKGFHEETNQGHHTIPAGIHCLSITFSNASLSPTTPPSSLLDEIQLAKEEESIELKLMLMSDLTDTAQVNHTNYKESTCEGKTTADTDVKKVLEWDISLPAFLNIRAVYIKGKEGEDRITGSSSYSSQTSSGELFDCPSVVTTQRWSIELNRQPEKDS